MCEIKVLEKVETWWRCEQVNQRLFLEGWWGSSKTGELLISLLFFFGLAEHSSVEKRGKRKGERKKPQLVCVD